MYKPLWTSLLVAMHDDIENRSISETNVIDILLIPESVESANPQKEYVVLCTIKAHSQTEYT